MSQRLYFGERIGVTTATAPWWNGYVSVLANPKGSWDNSTNTLLLAEGSNLTMVTGGRPSFPLSYQKIDNKTGKVVDSREVNVEGVIEIIPKPGYHVVLRFPANPPGQVEVKPAPVATTTTPAQSVVAISPIKPGGWTTGQIVATGATVAVLGGLLYILFRKKGY